MAVQSITKVSRTLKEENSDLEKLFNRLANFALNTSVYYI